MAKRSVNRSRERSEREKETPRQSAFLLPGNGADSESFRWQYQHSEDAGTAGSLLERERIAHDLAQIESVLSSCPGLGQSQLGPVRFVLDAVLSDLRLWVGVVGSRAAVRDARLSKRQERIRDYTRRA